MGPGERAADHGYEEFAALVRARRQAARQQEELRRQVQLARAEVGRDPVAPPVPEGAPPIPQVTLAPLRPPFATAREEPILRPANDGWD